MGLEVVVNEIVEEGRKEADRIEREGLQEAKKILEDAREKATRILDERNELAQRESKRIGTQDTARAEFEAKRRVLVAKRRLWERLKEETLRELSRLPDDQRKRLLQRLVDQARDEIPEGVVHVRKEDASLVSPPRGLRVEGDLEGVGGAVIETSEGTVSLDLTFESLLDDLWPQVLKEESKRLFR